MITKVKHKGFKGLPEREWALGRLTCISGPNGAGKSAITQAIQLAILGYLPQDQAKQAGAIYHMHGGTSPMTLSVEIGTHAISRKYSQNQDGAVSQAVKVDGKAVKRDDVEPALIAAGAPRVFDLRAFLSASGPAQVRYLMQLCPPDMDVDKLEAQEAALAAKENALRSRLREHDATIGRITEELNKMQLPSATLPHVRAQIEQVAQEGSHIEVQLRNARNKEREERFEIEKQAAVLREIERLREEEWMAPPALPPELEEKQEAEAPPLPPPKEAPDAPPPPAPEPVEYGEMVERLFPPPELATRAVNKILSTMRDIGCDCPAKMTALSMLARLEGGREI